MIDLGKLERIAGFAHSPPPCSDANFQRALNYLNTVIGELVSALDRDTRHNLQVLEFAGIRKGDGDLFETSKATQEYNRRAAELLRNGNGRGK